MAGMSGRVRAIARPGPDIPAICAHPGHARRAIACSIMASASSGSGRPDLGGSGHDALDHRIPGSLRPRPRGHPRRRQLAGPGLPRGRWRAALHRQRPRSLAHRRRRQPLRRPHLLVGPDDPRARPPRRARQRHRRRGQGILLRYPERERGGPGRRDRRARGAAGAGAPRLLGDRGDDVRPSSGAGRDRPLGRREVRWLLPRPRGRPSRAGRFGGGDFCAAGLRRCARVGSGRDGGAARQRPGRGRGARRRAWGGDRRGDHRGIARQHGRRAAGARVHRGAASNHVCPRGTAHQRRGHDRVPLQPLGLVRPRDRCRGSPPRRLPERCPGPVHLRQGHGWRLPRRGLRRPRRPHGATGARRARLPGRHALG